MLKRTRMLRSRSGFIKTHPVPSIQVCLRLLKQASMSTTQDGAGLLFDELEKKHYLLNSTYFFIARQVAADRGYTRFIDLVHQWYPEATAQDVTVILCALWQTGLFEEHDFLLARPPFSMMLEFICWNIYYQICLLGKGWKRVVAPIRLAQSPRSPAKSASPTVVDPPPIVDDVLAAALHCYGLPFISVLCVPVALALYRMLTRRRYNCLLVIGSPPSPLLPHMWVELDGYRVDTVIYQFEENPYEAYYELF